VPPPGRKYRLPPRTGPDTSGWTAEEKAAHAREEQLKTPIAAMNLPVRVIDTLEDHDVVTAADLVKQTYASLMVMKNFGATTLAEVRAAVVALGLPDPKWKKPPAPRKPRKPKKPKPPRAGDSFFNPW